MVNVDARDKEVKAAEVELKAETAEIEKEKEDARRVTAEDQSKLCLLYTSDVYKRQDRLGLLQAWKNIL